MSTNKGEFKIEILPDGKLRITAAGAFAPEIHASADELFALIVKLSGGEVVSQKHLDGHTHHHHGMGAHTHEHGDASHKH